MGLQRRPHVAGEVRVAGMVLWALDAVHSPDLDGDGLVALGDLSTWQQAFVHQEPLWIGDLDGDGMIALSDLLLWQQHFTGGG